MDSLPLGFPQAVTVEQGLHLHHSARHYYPPSMSTADTCLLERYVIRPSVSRLQQQRRPFSDVWRLDCRADYQRLV